MSEHFGTKELDTSAPHRITKIALLAYNYQSRREGGEGGKRYITHLYFTINGSNEALDLSEYILLRDSFATSDAPDLWSQQ